MHVLSAAIELDSWKYESSCASKRWAASAVRGFRFSEPSALAAGFGADDATYSVIVKRQTIRAQRTSIGRTTNSQRPQLRDPWLTPAAHKAQYQKAQYQKAQYPKNSRPANKHWTKHKQPTITASRLVACTVKPNLGGGAGFCDGCIRHRRLE